MVIAVVERGLITQNRSHSNSHSNPIASFQTVAFWFKVFNKQMKQKTNMISIKISKENFVHLT